MSLLWYYVGNAEVWKYLCYFSNIKDSRLALLFLLHCTTQWRLCVISKILGEFNKSAEKLASELMTSHGDRWPWIFIANLLSKISFNRFNQTTNFKPSSGTKIKFPIVMSTAWIHFSKFAEHLLCARQNPNLTTPVPLSYESSQLRPLVTTNYKSQKKCLP